MLSEDLVREIVALRRRVERLEAQEPVAGALRGPNAEIDAEGNATFAGGLNVGTATGAAAGEIALSGSLKQANQNRTLDGSKNIGDNVATAILHLHGDGVNGHDALGVLMLYLTLSPAAAPTYAGVTEVWMVAVRVYHEGGRFYATGTPVMIGRSDSGSKTPTHLDVGNGAVTTTVDNTLGNIGIWVQCDGTGSYGGSKDVLCTYHAEWHAIAGNMNYVSLAPL